MKAKAFDNPSGSRLKILPGSTSPQQTLFLYRKQTNPTHETHETY